MENNVMLLPATSSIIARRSIPGWETVKTGLIASAVATVTLRFCWWTMAAAGGSSVAASSPFVIPAESGKHSATVIFLHGLGDTGHGWAPVFDEIRQPHVKYICPHAPQRAVTLNMGMRMPAWFDLYGLQPGGPEDAEGIAESSKILHKMLNKEVESGIPSDRIVIGGFSMGGALALYGGFTYDKPLAGIVALSSFLLQGNKLPGNHTANRSVHIFQGHGTADQLVSPVFGKMTRDAIKKFDENIEYKEYQGMAHSSCDEEIKDVKKFLAKQLPPK